MHLGFIGFGEAAFELASGLKEQGIQKMKAYDHFGMNRNIANLLEVELWSLTLQ